MKVSDRIAAELKALEKLPDADIDTSEIAETSDWTGAMRGRFNRSNKRPVTIRLDAEIIDYFKKIAGDGGRYQAEINRALREWIAAQRARTS